MIDSVHWVRANTRNIAWRAVERLPVLVCIFLLAAGASSISRRPSRLDSPQTCERHPGGGGDRWTRTLAEAGTEHLEGGFEMHTNDTNNETIGQARNEPWPSHIKAQHVAYLRARAITLAVAIAAGIRTVDPREGANWLGFEHPLSSSGLLFPYEGVKPRYARVRLDNPTGNTKYLCPADREVPVYVSPGFVDDPAKPLLVVESPAKALSVLRTGT